MAGETAFQRKRRRRGLIWRVIVIVLLWAPAIASTVLMIITLFWRGLYQSPPSPLDPSPYRIAIEHGSILYVTENGAQVPGRRTLGVMTAPGWYWHRMNAGYSISLVWGWFEWESDHKRIPLWFVGAITGVPLIGISVVRTIRRRRRPPGACQGCGYDLRGLRAGSPCPECGAGNQS